MVIGMVMMVPPGVGGRLGTLGGPIHAGRSLETGPRSASVSFATGVSTTASIDGGADGTDGRGLLVVSRFIVMLVMEICSGGAIRGRISRTA